MANFFKYKEKEYKVGDTIAVNYKLKEAGKERLQLFKGIIIKIKGDSEPQKMLTLRKITRSGIGVERIIPLASPYIESVSLLKKTNYRKSRLYFIRDLSGQELKSKLYQTKKSIHKAKKTILKK